MRKSHTESQGKADGKPARHGSAQGWGGERKKGKGKGGGKKEEGGKRKKN